MTEIYNYAVKLLAQREHSRFELQRKLIHKGFSEQCIIQTLQTLLEQGLQSDERFVEAYVQMRLRRGYGPVRIAGELRERGVADELIQKHLQLDNDKDKEDWQQQIVSVWQKKFRSIKPKDFAERAKQMRFLQYRGFNGEQIKWLFTSVM